MDLSVQSDNEYQGPSIPYSVGDSTISWHMTGLDLAPVDQFFKTVCMNMNLSGIQLTLNMKNGLVRQRWRHLYSIAVLARTSWFIIRVIWQQWIDPFKGYCVNKHHITDVLISKSTKWLWRSRSKTFTFNKLFHHAMIHNVCEIHNRGLIHSQVIEWTTEALYNYTAEIKTLNWINKTKSTIRHKHTQMN